MRSNCWAKPSRRVAATRQRDLKVVFVENRSCVCADEAERQDRDWQLVAGAAVAGYYRAPYMPKIFLQSLGCPKNLVDSEQMLGLLAHEGMEIVLDPESADVVVVNTCGFIDGAKKESIDTILELGKLKEEDSSKRLVVTGCLVQRYGKDLQKSLPEVDAFLGTGDFTRLPDLLREIRPPDASAYGGAAHILPELAVPRVRTGHFFSAYLKVSEGCDHTCAFCIIPKIRGKHESRPVASILAEAQSLAAEGVVELNLIAQDLTAYGRDRRDGTTLAMLLRELAQIDGLRWIRLLYNYPRYVTDELLDTIAMEDKVCSYIDIPLQHISDRMLRAMRRERDGAAIRRLLKRIRERIPGVGIRSSFIVGFPGETEADFQELLEFIQASELDRAGVFKYSREVGTAAAEMPDQVHESTKRRRYHQFMRTQSEVAAAVNRRLVGTVRPVLVCGTDDDGKFYGRLSTQAPEIDGVVYLDDDMEIGSIAPVQIVAADVYDLHGKAPIDGSTYVDSISQSL